MRRNGAIGGGMEETAEAELEAASKNNHHLSIWRSAGACGVVLGTHVLGAAKFIQPRHFTSNERDRSLVIEA
jgi:hypothetical protein